MLNISLELNLERDDSYRNRALQVLLWTLIHLDELYLKRYPHTPSIYSSGVRYIREPLGYEQWVTIPEILKQGGADCEDLAAWRVAELRRQGIDARPMWNHRPIQTPRGVATMFHIRVWNPKRGVEDPSALLGMHDNPPTLGVGGYPAHWAIR